MNASIKKLPGTKKQIPYVKPVVDCERTVKPVPPALANASSIPTQNGPVASHSGQLVATPGTAKNGFRYRGFGSTSITPVIPKDKITRPLFKKQEKSQSRPDWNASPKVKEEKPMVTKTAMTGPKLEPFKARPVPRSHYEPFRPVLPSKTDKQGEQNPVAELACRMWRAMVDPIFHPKEVCYEWTAQEPEEKETVSESPVQSRKHSTSEAETDKVLPTEDAVEPPANPGLLCRAWHSVVDPIFNPTNPDEEKLTEVNAKETEQEPKTGKSEVVENSAEDSPAELATESADETEKTPVMAECQPEETAVRCLPCRIWHSLVDPILHPEAKKAVDEELVDEESSSKGLSENEVLPEEDVEGAAGTQGMIKEHRKRPYSDSYLLKNRSEEIAEEEGSARPGSFQSVLEGDEAQPTKTRKKKRRVKKKNSQRKLTGNDE